MTTQINEITLYVNETEIVLTTHDVGGQQLYKAQDLLLGFGMTQERVKEVVYNWKRHMENRSADFAPHSIRGGNAQGTYLTKRQLMKLAGYVDYAFEDGVYEAFEKLVEGKVEEALEIAQSLAVEEVHDWMHSKRVLFSIKKKYIDLGIPFDEFVVDVLEKSMNNFKKGMTNQRRIKFANSLLSFVEWIDELAYEPRSVDYKHLLSIEKSKAAIKDYKNAREKDIRSRKVTAEKKKAENALIMVEVKDGQLLDKCLEATQEKMRADTNGERVVVAVTIARTERKEKEELKEHLDFVQNISLNQIQ